MLLKWVSLSITKMYVLSSAGNQRLVHFNQLLALSPFTQFSLFFCGMFIKHVNRIVYAPYVKQSHRLFLWNE
jgi:hypothetical protein